MLPINEIVEGDCLELMPQIADKSIDMILCDLPYGTTACSWDTIIPFEPLWAQYKRIIKDNGAIVLTASQPFTSTLAMSNIEMFRYEWIWDKVNMFTNHINAKKMPMKVHENICVFYKTLPIYNSQKRKGIPYGNVGNSRAEVTGIMGNSHKNKTGDMYAASLIRIKGRSGEQGFHPTQKPVALFEYLIKTYTNEGDLILDNCAGSGTTGVAAKNLKRNFILIEKEPKYVEIARKRLETVTPSLFNVAPKKEKETLPRE
jgi:site-specific DNA-methyltransferase (adenine-specific)